MEGLMLLYCVFAFFVGWRFMSGRVGWLEVNAPLNKVAKIGVSALVGYVFGGFLAVFLVLKFVYHLVRF